MSRARVPVIMPDGTRYEIHAYGYAKDGSPRHRVYRDVSRTIGRYTLRRVTDAGELARVAERLLHMKREVRREERRVRIFGERLVALWRSAMVFLDQMREWLRARRATRA